MSEEKSRSETMTELFDTCAEQLTERIKSGSFNDKDVKAAVDLMKLADVKIPLEKNKAAEALQDQLTVTDCETGETYDVTRPPDYSKAVTN